MRGDIVHVDRIIGLGELALSDHRSSQPTLDELLRLAQRSRQLRDLRSAEQINAISNAPDPSIAARLDELASKVEAGPGPGLLARLDQLSSRLDSTPDGGRLSDCLLYTSRCV